jgi:hypothetical protein
MLRACDVFGQFVALCIGGPIAGGVSMIVAYKKKSNSAAAVVLVAFLGAMVCNALNDPKLELVVAMLATIAGIAFWYSLWFYVKAKGRSGWWTLVIIFSLVGILILALLKDRATCDQSEVAATPDASHRKGQFRLALDKLNGWQRIWCVLVVISFLALVVAVVGLVEALCRNATDFVACTVSISVVALIMWTLAVVGIYVFGLAVAWVVRGFKNQGR